MTPQTVVVTQPSSADLPPTSLRRQDESDDATFYRAPRFVTHIDDGAIAAVGRLYAELGVDGGSGEPRRVLDLMSSWVSHLQTAPTELVVLGLNAAELAANSMATERVVQDLSRDPRLPFADASFDAVLCCVSVDYLVRPVEVLAEVARVLRPGSPLVVTFSNRCFPTKAVYAWLTADDAGHAAIVEGYVRAVPDFDPPVTTRRTPDPSTGYRGDPLFAVVATRRAGDPPTLAG